MIHKTKTIHPDRVLPDWRQLLPRLSLLTGLSGEPLLYDIETTGLSHQNAYVCLIGAASFREDHLELQQFFAESPSEEPEILAAFSSLLKGSDYTVQYNGTSFDQPFLRDRYAFFHLENDLDSRPSLDLYRVAKEYKAAWKLPNLRQPSVERFLQLPARQFPDGKAGIRLYFRYLKEKDPELLQMITGHNEEDLTGLCQILSLLAFRQPEKELFHIRKARTEENHLSLEGCFDVPFPVSFRYENEDHVLQIRKDGLLLRSAVKARGLKRYYPDFGNYEYLPGEDTAIPKSLSRFMDKSLRVPCTPETCYTWFDVKESFLENEKEQIKYAAGLIHLLLQGPLF